MKTKYKENMTIPRGLPRENTIHLSVPRTHSHESRTARAACRWQRLQIQRRGHERSKLSAKAGLSQAS